MKKNSNCANISNIDIEKSAKLLQFAQESGIISNIDDVEKAMKRAELEKILKQHPYKISFSSGRWQTYVQDDTQKSGRKKLVKSTEEKLNIALYEHYKELERSNSLSAITIEKLYPDWKEYKALRTTAQNYIRRINNDWKHYYINTEIIRIPIAKLNKFVLSNWAHTLIRNNNMTKNQYYNSTIIIRQILDYAVDLQIIENNPFSLVKIDGRRLFRQIKKKPNETQVFSKEELNFLHSMALEDFLSNTRLKYRLAPLSIIFQTLTGLRLGELCAVCYNDITGDYMTIERMYRPETGEIVQHTKGYEDREVYLTPEAKKIIRVAKEYQEEHGLNNKGYIFSCDSSPLSGRAVNGLYRKYCDKMDTIYKSSHKARKTFISALIDGNVNINTIRECVGHADERTTYNNYCFDRHTKSEREQLIELALS